MLENSPYCAEKCAVGAVYAKDGCHLRADLPVDDPA
jgi:hypothetical protein